MSVEFTLTGQAINELYELHPTIFVNPKQVGKARIESAYKVFADATENKLIKNNTVFMTHVYEQYGYDRHLFFVNNDVLFIANELTQKVTATLSCCDFSIIPQRVQQKLKDAKPKNLKEVRHLSYDEA